MLLSLLFIVVVGLDGKGPNFHRPVWSPDGQWFAFMSDSPGNWELFLLNLQTRELKRITQSPAFDGYAWWSPDSQKLSYSSEAKDGTKRIFLFDIHLNQTTVLARGALSGKFSPDGEQVLLVREDAVARNIYLMPLSGGGETALTQDRDSFNDDPIFSPDGNRIAYVNQVDEKFELTLMSPAGKTLSTLTTESSRFYGLDWSPDGQWLCYNAQRKAQFDIFKIHVDGGDPIRLTRHHSDDHLAVWIDNQTLGFTSYREGAEKIFLMNQNGRSIREFHLPDMPKNESIER